MDFFNIYIERLRGGRIQNIDECIDPSFIEVNEADLAFKHPVSIQGHASLAEDALVLQLKVQTKATIPCAICNQEVQINIDIDQFYVVEELKNIKSSIFNFKCELREHILIETPSKAECNEGACPERESVAKFLRKKTVDVSYQPFSDL